MALHCFLIPKESVTSSNFPDQADQLIVSSAKLKVPHKDINAFNFETFAGRLEMEEYKIVIFNIHRLSDDILAAINQHYLAEKEVHLYVGDAYNTDHLTGLADEIQQNISQNRFGPIINPPDKIQILKKQEENSQNKITWITIDLQKKDFKEVEEYMKKNLEFNPFEKISYKISSKMNESDKSNQIDLSKKYGNGTSNFNITHSVINNTCPKPIKNSIAHSIFCEYKKKLFFENSRFEFLKKFILSKKENIAISSKNEFVFTAFTTVLNAETVLGPEEYLCIIFDYIENINYEKFKEVILFDFEEESKFKIKGREIRFQDASDYYYEFISRRPFLLDELNRYLEERFKNITDSYEENSESSNNEIIMYSKSNRENNFLNSSVNSTDNSFNILQKYNFSNIILKKPIQKSMLTSSIGYSVFPSQYSKSFLVLVLKELADSLKEIDIFIESMNLKEVFRNETGTYSDSVSTKRCYISGIGISGVINIFVESVPSVKKKNCSADGSEKILMILYDCKFVDEKFNSNLTQFYRECLKDKNFLSDNFSNENIQKCRLVTFNNLKNLLRKSYGSSSLEKISKIKDKFVLEEKVAVQKDEKFSHLEEEVLLKIASGKFKKKMLKKTSSFDYFPRITLVLIKDEMKCMICKKENEFETVSDMFDPTNDSISDSGEVQVSNDFIESDDMHKQTNSLISHEQTNFSDSHKTTNFSHLDKTTALSDSNKQTEKLKYDNILTSTFCSSHPFDDEFKTFIYGKEEEIYESDIIDVDLLGFDPNEKIMNNTVNLKSDTNDSIVDSMNTALNHKQISQNDTFILEKNEINNIVDKNNRIIDKPESNSSESCLDINIEEHTEEIFCDEESNSTVFVEKTSSTLDEVLSKISSEENQELSLFKDANNEIVDEENNINDEFKTNTIVHNKSINDESETNTNDESTTNTYDTSNTGIDDTSNTGIDDTSNTGLDDIDEDLLIPKNLSSYSSKYSLYTFSNSSTGILCPPSFKSEISIRNIKITFRNTKEYSSTQKSMIEFYQYIFFRSSAITTPQNGTQKYSLNYFAVPINQNFEIDFKYLSEVSLKLFTKSVLEIITDSRFDNDHLNIKNSKLFNCIIWDMSAKSFVVFDSLYHRNIEEEFNWDKKSDLDHSELTIFKTATFNTFLEYFDGKAPDGLKTRTGRVLYKGIILNHFIAQSIKSNPNFNKEIFSSELGYLTLIDLSIIDEIVLFPYNFHCFQSACLVHQFMNEFEIVLNNVNSINNMVLALTPTNVSATHNYERLEFLGDIVLKYITTNYLVMKAIYNDLKNNNNLINISDNNINVNIGMNVDVNINMNVDIVGDTVQQKDWYLCNKVLSSICIANKIHKFISFPYARKAFQPPTLNESQKTSKIMKYFNVDKTFNSDSLNAHIGSKFYSTNIKEGLEVKLYADVLEAITGAIYLEGGLKEVILFYYRIGLFSNESSNSANNKFSNSINNSIKKDFSDLENRKFINDISNSKFITDIFPFNIDFKIPFLNLISKEEIKFIESILGYTFVNSGFIERAVSHPSFSNQMKLEEFNILELVGDCTLDLMIAKKLYFLEECATPLDLHSYKKSFVNNISLGNIIKKTGVYKLIRRTGKISLKAYGDIFEAIIGAILVDLKWNLKEFEKVYSEKIVKLIEKEQGEINYN